MAAGLAQTQKRTVQLSIQSREVIQAGSGNERGVALT